MISKTQGKKDRPQSGVVSQMPVGNSWIVCDSKSRPGFKYFFNTLSGEAVWNLNNKDQVEKAKRHTQILHKLGKVPELPEPQGQPPLDAPRNFNLPIINQMSNFCNFLNTGPRNYNGNVWANPPAVVQQPQIVLIPTVAPMLNTAIANNNLQPTLAFQNTPFTYQNYGEFNNVPYNSSRGRIFRNNTNKYQDHNRNKKHDQIINRNQHQNPTSYKQDSQDLRQKLARKRTITESNVENKYEYLNSNSNDSENATNEVTEEIDNKLPAFPLEDCYVVVDKDIILSEFVFFDNLVSNDPTFRLIVPHQVMKELKTQACVNSEVRVRRVVRFLSQKIESQLVSLGNEITDDPHNKGNQIYTTCEKLVENGNNVILVSNNPDMRKFSGNNDKIKIMTMYMFKNMLTNTKVRFSSPTRAIKIIVPNNVMIDIKNDNDSMLIVEESNSQRNNTDNEEESRKEVNIDKNEPETITSPSKQTVDTAVQTDMPTVHTNNEANTVMNDNVPKKKEIRLNRTTPIKRAKIEDKLDTREPSNKKQFKWRKNRAPNNSSNNFNQLQSCPNVSKTTSNIGTDTIMNAAEPTKVAAEESKKRENSSQTYNEIDFAVPKTNSARSSTIDRETKITKEVNRQTSTESWVDSLPKSNSTKNNTDKDSLYGSSNKTNSSTSIPVKNINSVVHKVPVRQVQNKGITLRNVEMFPVAGQCMEEMLRTRSDEWVSRFVQIMEEILREKLQEDPPFDNEEYPPPWNLHEAARCIIKKYSNYFNVVDAANKLSFILYKISDEKGKILLSLQPSEFMEMYSYGVYLVETLQDVSTNCDDLHAAKESLKILLYDIQNAYMETTDTFGDDLYETIVECSTSTNITESDFKPGPEQSTPKKPSQKRCTTNAKAKGPLNTESYNLRSAKKTSEALDVHQSKSLNIDKKTSFMSNLKLITRSISSPSTITSPTYSNFTIRSPIKSPVKSQLTEAAPKCGNTSKNVDIVKNDEEIVSSSGQPSFVRNFQICPEFEARINKARSILELNDCDDVYSDVDDQYNDNSLDYKMCKYFKINNCGVNNMLKDFTVDTEDKSNKHLNKLGRSLGILHIKDLKETFADVIKTFSISRFDTIKKEELKTVAIRLYPRMEFIYDTLDIVLKRDEYFANDNFDWILKGVNADPAQIETFCLRYRNTIKKYRNQAHFIIKYLKLILSKS